MSKFNFKIDDDCTFAQQYEGISHLNFFQMLLRKKKMKNIQLIVDEEKVSVDGNRSWKGKYHLDLNRKDFRGVAVELNSIRILLILLGGLLAGIGVFGLLVYSGALLDDEGGTEALGVGFLFLIIGIIIIIWGFVRRSTRLSLRFVDPNSNSVRSITIITKKRPSKVYDKANEFIGKFYS